MSENQPSTRSVDRALRLLAEVTDAGEVALAEVARKAQVPTSTALRLLRTLEEWGFVRRGTHGDYRAGPRLMQLAVSAFSADSLVHHARPHLSALCEFSGESSYLAITAPRETAVYLDQVETNRSIRHASWIGRSVPLDGTAIGAVLREEVGEQGYVVNRSTLEPDVTAVAAPVRLGEVIASLSVVGPTYRITDYEAAGFGIELVKHARDLAAELGGK